MLSFQIPKISTSYFRKQNQEIILIQRSLKEHLFQSLEFTDEETEAHKEDEIPLHEVSDLPGSSWYQMEMCVNWISFPLSYITILALWFINILQPSLFSDILSVSLVLLPPLSS